MFHCFLTEYLGKRKPENPQLEAWFIGVENITLVVRICKANAAIGECFNDNGSGVQGGNGENRIEDGNANQCELY